MSKLEWLKERAFTLASEIVMLELDFGDVPKKLAVELAETVLEVRKAEREETAECGGCGCNQPCRCEDKVEGIEL